MADNDGLFGMGGVGLLVILFFLMSGGGFGGWGNNQAATSNEVQRGFDNQNSMANQREILSAVNAGTAQSVATTNQTFHDTIGYLGDKYNELTRDIGSLSVAQAQALANQNECCCSTKMLISDTAAQNRYDALVNTNALSKQMDAGFSSIREKLDANKIEELQAQISQLQLAQATSNVVRYPNAWTWNAGPSPFCGGCGCGA